MKTDSQMPEFTDNPNRTKDCTATVCKSCQTSLDNAPVIGHERRQLFDIPAVNMKVTEYRVEVRKCPKCDHKNHLNFPGLINQRTQYGHNVRDYAVYFNKNLRFPVKKTVETFRNIFETTISEEVIIEAVENDGQPYDSKYCPEFIKDHNKVEIQVIEVKICEKCGHSLENTPIMGYSRRQVFDIPTVGMEVTEYQGNTRQCPNCKKRNQPDFPNSVSEVTQYGDKVKLYASHFKTYLRIPAKKTTKIFEDIFGYPVSEAFLNKINKEGEDESENPKKKDFIYNPELPVISQREITQSGEISIVPYLFKKLKKQVVYLTGIFCFGLLLWSTLFVIKNWADISKRMESLGSKEIEIPIEKSVNISSLHPDRNGGEEIYISALIHGRIDRLDEDGHYDMSDIDIKRSFMRFDLSSIPDTALILDARLLLYKATSHVHQGNRTTSGPNTSLLQRVTSKWDADTITWNKQPKINDKDQIVLNDITDSDDVHNKNRTHSNAQQTSKVPIKKDYWDIDVKNMVQKMIMTIPKHGSKNHGFMLRLQTEMERGYYNYDKSMLFSSGLVREPSLRPKLVVRYKRSNHTPVIDEDETEKEEKKIEDMFTEFDEKFGKLRPIPSKGKKQPVTTTSINNRNSITGLGVGDIKHFNGKVLGMKKSDIKIPSSLFGTTIEGSINLDIEDGKTYKISAIVGIKSDGDNYKDRPHNSSEINNLLETTIFDKLKETERKAIFDIDKYNHITNTLYFMNDRCFKLIFDFPQGNISYSELMDALMSEYGGALDTTGRWVWETEDIEYRIYTPHKDIIRLKAMYKPMLDDIKKVVETAHRKKGEGWKGGPPL